METKEPEEQQKKADEEFPYIGMDARGVDCFGESGALDPGQSLGRISLEVLLGACYGVEGQFRG